MKLTMNAADEPERPVWPWANNGANPLPVPSVVVNTTGTVTYTGVPITTNCAAGGYLPTFTVYTVTS